MAARLPRRNHTSNNNLGRGLSLRPMLFGFLGCEKKTNDQAVRVKNVLPQMQAPVRMKLKTSKNLLPAYCILGGL